MARRLELQIELETLLNNKNVYFQPPETEKLNYPCIVYTRKNISSNKANDKNYLLHDEYELTLIYRNPDSQLTHKILEHFKYCNFGTHFVSDNLNHDTFNLFY